MKHSQQVSIQVRFSLLFNKAVEIFTMGVYDFPMLEIAPEILDFKTWSYKVRNTLFQQKNWHQIKDHGLVSEKMVL